MPSPSEQLVAPTDARPSVFISNIETTLAEDGYATGCMAQKVQEISPRTVWYGEYETIVVPTEPDAAFVDYAASLGREPRIVVPDGIDTQRLSIYDGFGDARFQAAVHGRWVESYIGDGALYGFTALHGGRYGNGDPSHAVAVVNDKANFRAFAGSEAPSPPGELATGLGNIAEAVGRLLAEYGDVYVRHTRSAGGLGNRHFEYDGRMPSSKEIVANLIGDQRRLWETGSALVERFVPLVGSPAVTVRAGEGIAYDGYQLTDRTKYVGCWLPLPPQIWDPEDMQSFGDGLARRLGGVGFWGWAGADLGIGPNGERYGFEINGRTVGSRHSVEVGEHFLGPWQTWRDEGITIKAVDRFVLSKVANFPELHATLNKLGCLATRDNPFGVVITIPPAGRIAGVQVQGQGYRQTEALYQQVVAAVGDPRANREDHPLLQSPLMQGAVA
jgi:hypothetical protein